MRAMLNDPTAGKRKQRTEASSPMIMGIKGAGSTAGAQSEPSAASLPLNAVLRFPLRLEGVTISLAAKGVALRRPKEQP